MFEIKFTGNTFLEVRKEIQEFAINHLQMKFGVGEGAAVGVGEGAAVGVGEGAAVGVAPREVTQAFEGAPKSTMHTMTENAAIVPEKRKPGRQPGFSPKKKGPPLAVPVDDDDYPLTAVPVAEEIPTEEAAQAMISKVMEKLGPEKAKRVILDKILPEFGVKRGRDLKPEQRAKFMAQCEQAML